jgi:tRNA(fMet)-specific endonuclease VapC
VYRVLQSTFRAVDRTAAVIRVNLEAIGRPIGANDLMIAATARSRGRIVVTKNRGEFDRVPELLVEDWTIP